MTRLRAGMACALALLATLAAVRSLLAYVHLQLWLASATVLVLLAALALGLGNLVAARRRLARELAGLLATPPRGSLVQARRTRLHDLRMRGVTPDTTALAETVRAEETGRAFVGKYLVAVTVMVGLVGTFAGLAETMHRLAPLLADPHVQALDVLAAPLGGLDVTFGASVVGILVTLALALVQGDLLLLEERVLARLEEVTTHDLLPELWPPGESAAERTARELGELRRELGAMLPSALARGTEQLTAIAREELGRLCERVEGALAETTAAAEAGTTRATAALQSCVADGASALQASAARQEQVATRCEAALRGSADQQAQRTAALAGSLEQLGTRVLTELDAQTQAQTAALRQLSVQHGQALGALLGEHTAGAARVAETACNNITQAAGTAAARLERLADQLANELEVAAAALGADVARSSAILERAARGFEAAASAMAMPLATLSPELAALSRELALLAVRAEQEEAPLLDELLRLGEGLDRLEGLVRMAQGDSA
jgi:hypothetical protein